MMMNQGAVTNTVTTLDNNNNISLEHQAVDPSHAQAPSYYAPPPGSESTSWTSYNHDQRSEPHSRSVQDGSTVASAATASSSGAASHQAVDPSHAQAPSYYAPPPGSESTSWTSYNHDQRSSRIPLTLSSSRINHILSSSLVNHTLSSSRIIHTLSSNLVKHTFNQQEPIKVQTSGGYPTASYNSQTNTWNQGSYASYAHQYPNYTAESNGAYNAQSAPAPAVQYQQDYKQWTDYYSQTEVTCAPGTENVASTSTSNVVSPLPAAPSGYSASTSQQQLATTAPSSWRPEFNLSELSSVQPSAATNNVHEGYWKQGVQGYQSYHASSLQSNFQKPLDSNPVSGSFQTQQQPEITQQPNVQYSASYQVAQTYQPSLATAPQTAAPFESAGVTKPAYIGVSLSKPNDNVSSSAAAADSSLKPGTLPKSLRGYVERALSRCKDDKQMAACQDVLKEVITKASIDGTLATRDWDTEPLFALPNTDVINNGTSISSTPPSSLLKSRRSPTRRTKSRWEPLPEEKPR
nr:SAC3 family protein A isoform X1 [Tanacetum cinerariifolium]